MTFLDYFFKSKTIARKKIIAFDFDGVIASYNGWKGKNVFGSINPEIQKTINYLYDNQYYILIFTTRIANLKLKQYLKDNNIKYHAINSKKHNPKNTSIKPIYDVFIDDRAIRYNGQDFNLLIDAISNVLNKDK